jgi:hypothetical protein
MTIITLVCRQRAQIPSAGHVVGLNIGFGSAGRKMSQMGEDQTSDLPDEHDVIIWHLEERDGLDVYRITKGSTVIGEFTGRSISSAVFQTAVDHAEAGRAVWLKDDLALRRLRVRKPDELSL